MSLARRRPRAALWWIDDADASAVVAKYAGVDDLRDAVASRPADCVLPAVLAVASAVAAGAAVVAQQRATHELGGAGRRLLRSPWWLAGTGASVVAVGLQAVALRNGPLGMVQALLSGAVAWAALGETLLARRVPPPRDRAGCGARCGRDGHRGRPPALGHQHRRRRTALRGPGRRPCGGGRGARRPRAVVDAAPSSCRWLPGLAVAYGAGYGLAASLLAVLARTLPTDLGGALGDPRLILATVALVVIGPTAFVLSQHALARAHHVGPPMTIILLADRLVATATGVVWFGEHVALDPPILVGLVLAVGASITGTLLLTDFPGAVRAQVVEERTIALVIWLAAIGG